mgnify:CR=1 FL=1
MFCTHLGFDPWQHLPTGTHHWGVETKTRPMTGGRVAYTFAEFADQFGRERTWTYKLAAKKKIKVIRGYGKAMVPASEVDRILEEGSQA